MRTIYSIHAVFIVYKYTVYAQIIFPDFHGLYA